MIVSVDLKKFDFDFWNNNRVRVLLVLVERGVVDDVNFLSLITGLGYATVHRIVQEFEEKGLVVKNGRSIVLVEKWRDLFV